MNPLLEKGKVQLVSLKRILQKVELLTMLQILLCCIKFENVTNIAIFEVLQKHFNLNFPIRGTIYLPQSSLSILWNSNFFPQQRQVYREQKLGVVMQLIMVKMLLMVPMMRLVLMVPMMWLLLMHIFRAVTWMMGVGRDRWHLVCPHK